MAHEHGPHNCYCPECGYTTEVGESVKCNTLPCPNCGARLRAVETGELRARSGVMLATATTESVPCPVCKYPIQAPTFEGQLVRCPYCNSVSEAIIAQGITIPTPVFVGIIFFGLGILLGPSVWALSEGGSEWLAKKAKERFK